MAAYESPSRDESRDSLPPMPSFTSIVRGFVGLFGVGLMCVGAWYVVFLIGRFSWALVHPIESQRLIDEWAQVVGNGEATFKIGDQEGTMSIGKIVGGVVLGGGHIALAYLAVALMMAGSRVVVFSTGEREAVKKLIAEALKGKPED